MGDKRLILVVMFTHHSRCPEAKPRCVVNANPLLRRLRLRELLGPHSPDPPASYAREAMSLTPVLSLRDNEELFQRLVLPRQFFFYDLFVHSEQMFRRAL